LLKEASSRKSLRSTNTLIEPNATALMLMKKNAFTFVSINTDPIEMAYKHSYVSNALKV